MQYLTFPQGILYNLQNNAARIHNVNSIFYSIRYLAWLQNKIKKTNFHKIAFLVEVSG